MQHVDSAALLLLCVHWFSQSEEITHVTQVTHRISPTTKNHPEDHEHTHFELLVRVSLRCCVFVSAMVL